MWEWAPPRYNSKLGYNSNFLCLEYEGVDNVGIIIPTILTRYADYLVVQA